MECKTKNEYLLILNDCITIADFCRALNLKPTGGNYNKVHNIINEYGLDDSHLLGLHWKLGKHVQGVKNLLIEDILVENSSYKNTNHLKERLLRLHIKEPICEACGYNDNIELHHINGNSSDNRIENLLILCPNCHAKTKNFRGKNIKSREHIPAKDTILTNEQVYERDYKKNKSIHELNYKKNKSIYDQDLICLKCGTIFHSRHILKYCSQECYREDTSGNRPSLLLLLSDFKELKSFLQVGKKYNVSDNAVRKWCKLYGLPEKVSMINEYLEI